ncbi:MAG: lipopolysaccharide biosynthesis protein [Treponema sp.]|nr:lipopolysaccharide biosynthesis protein [Treponema sp.]
MTTSEDIKIDEPTANSKVEVSKNEKDDEISLIDLVAVLLKHRFLIIITTLVAAFAVVIYSVVSLKLPPEKSYLPNTYKPKATMIIMNNDSGGSSIASMLSSSGLGSLAGLAGVSTGGSSNSALATYLLKSDSFLDSITDKFGLIEKWEIEKAPRTTTRDTLKKMIDVSYEGSTGVFTVSCEDTDPQFACEIVDFCVEKLEQKFLELGLDKNILEKKNLEENIDLTKNKIIELENEIRKLELRVSDVYSSSSVEAISLQTNLLKLELESQKSIYTQLKTQLELLKINLATEKPLFQILERASIPDQKSGPSRGKLCIIVTFAAFFVSVFLAFLLNAIGNIKKDEEAMKKLSVGRRVKKSGK